MDKEIFIMKRKIKNIITPCILSFTCAVSAMAVPVLAEAPEGDKISSQRSNSSRLVLSIMNKDKTERIQGVKIDLYGPDSDSFIDSYTTDENGTITVDSLDVGRYYFKITEAPEAYYFDRNQSYTFEIEQDHTAFGYDICLGDAVQSLDYVTFHVTEADNSNIPIIGAVIGWYDENKELIKTVTIGEDGNATLDNLTEGTYYYKVESVPDGYKIGNVTGTLQEIVLSSDNWINSIDIQILKDDTKSKTLNVCIIDEESESVIPGAVVELYKQDGTTKVGEAVTGENGMAVFTGLTESSYIIREKSMPDGYSVNTQKEYPLTFQNSEGTYTIRKMRVEDLLKLKFVDALTQESVTGITVEIRDKNNNNLYSTHQDENGIITIGEIPEGDYIFIITEAPDEYSAKGLSGDLPKEVGIVRYELSLKEAATSGKLTISITDSEGNDVDGVEIALRSSDGSYQKTLITKNESGALVSDLPFGDYSWSVVSVPEGYLKPSGTFSLTLSESKPVIKTSLALNKTSDTVKVIFTFSDMSDSSLLISGVKGTVYTKAENKKIADIHSENGKASIDLPSGDYVLKITDGNGYGLKNISFGVTAGGASSEYPILIKLSKLSGYTLRASVKDSNGNPVSGARIKFMREDDSVIDTYESGDDGLIVVSEIPSSKVKYQMISVPNGFYLDEDVYSMNFTQGYGTYTTDIILKESSQVKGNVTVIIKDTEENKVPGAGMKLTHLESGKELSATTDENGEISFAGLELGEYSYEITSVPDGYLLPSKPDKTLNVSSVPIRFTYTINLDTSQKSGTKVIKFFDDENREQQLSGFEIKAYQSNGQRITVNHGTDGSIVIPNLLMGDYYFVVTNAPEGYSSMVSDKRHEFHVSEYLTEHISFYAKKDVSVSGTAVIKVLDHHKDPVAGACVRVTLPDGSVRSLNTGNDGSVRFTELAEGEYSYSLESLPEGYILSDTRETFTITKEIQSFTGTIAVIKQEGYVLNASIKNSDGDPVSDVTMKIMDESGNMISTATTGADGQIHVEGIQAENIRYQISSVPNGYYLDESLYHVEFSGGYGTYETEILVKKDHEVKGKFSIIIEDDEKNKIGGVTVRLQNRDTGNEIAGTTNAEGLIVFEDLERGNYSYEIVSVPDGYLLPEKETETINITDVPIEFRYTLGKDTSPKSATQILKFFDNEDKTKQLTGISVNVFKATGESVATSVGEDGTITIPNLLKGDYYYIVTSAPDEYSDMVTEEQHAFSVSEFTTKTVSIYVNKNIPVNGNAVFTVKDEDNNAVSEVIIRLTGPGQEDRMLTTNANGSVSVSELVEGEYSFEVVSAPLAYHIPEGVKSFTITKTMQSLTSNITLSKVSGNVLIGVRNKGGKIAGVSVRLKNISTGEMRQSVSDEDGNVSFRDLIAGTYEITVDSPDGFKAAAPQTVIISRTQQAVVKEFELEKKTAEITFNILNPEHPDVTISIYKKNGELVKSGNTLNGTFNMGILEYGEYYYIIDEVPDLYEDINGRNSFMVEEDTSVLEITLTKVTGTFEVELSDEEKQPVTGKVEAVLENTQTGNKTNIVIMDGRASISGLEPGNYEFKTTSIPEEYKGSLTQEFSLSKNVKSFTFTGQLVKRKYGVVNIQAFDQNGNTSLNTEYQIVNQETKEIISGNISDGPIELEYGSYSISLTTPDGYEPYGAITTIFGVDSQEKELPFYYRKIVKGSIMIHIQDSDQNPLANVKMRITGADGFSGELTTDTNGKALIQDLLAGDYQIVITEAPEGYLVDSRTYETSISDSVTTQAITVSLEKQTQETHSVDFKLMDQELNEAIAGRITIIKTDESTPVEIGTYSTTDGIIHIEGLTTGKYQYKVLLDGRYVPVSDGTFEVVSGQETAEITLKTIVKSGNVFVAAIDRDTNQMVKGLSLVVDGQTYPLTSGQVNIPLKYGTHPISLSNIPEDYELVGDFDENLIVDSASKNISISLAKKNGSVKIKVRDNHTALFITGTIKIYDKDKHEIATKSLSNMGTVFDNLRPGNYYYEIIPSEDVYKQEILKVPFEIEANKNSDIIAELYRKQGMLTFHIIDDAKQPVAGAEITIKSNVTGDVSVYTSADDGTSKTDRLAYGTYSYNIKVPEGYELVTEGSLLVDAETSEMTIELKKKPEVGVEKKPGLVELQVLSTGYGTVPEIHVTSQIGDYDSFIYAYKEAGSDEWRTGMPTSELKPGRYLLKVTATETEHYKQTEAEKFFEIFKLETEKPDISIVSPSEIINRIPGGPGMEFSSDEGNTWTDWTDNLGYVKAGKYEIRYKEDDYHKASESITVNIRDAIVAVLDENDKIVLQIDVHAGNVITKEQLPNLEKEGYDISGWKMDDSEPVIGVYEKEFIPGKTIITSDVRIKAEYKEKENSTKPDAEKNEFHIVLTDADGKPIADAVVNIYHPDGTLAESIKTDKNGKADTRLPYGDYYMEITGLPENCLDSIGRKEFTLDENKKFDENLKIEQKKDEDISEAKQGIIHVSGSDSKPIKGATVKITGNGTENIFITDENGNINITGLPDGSYQAVQVTVPAGYELNKEAIIFTIENGKVSKDLEFKNKKKNTQTTSRPSGGSYSGGSPQEVGTLGPGQKPVDAVQGTWLYDSKIDKWTLDNGKFKNEWVYAHNPYSSSLDKNDWFAFDEYGFMRTGWFTDSDGQIYYLNKLSDGTRGKMLTGWQWIDGKCYYFSQVSDGKKGHLVKDMITPDGYTVNANGEWTVNGTVITR